MKFTTNYQFLKPEYKDKVNVKDINDNSDSIDNKLKELMVSVSLLHYNKANIVNPIFKQGAKIQKGNGEPEDILVTSDLINALLVTNLDNELI